jgi:drug/metabolite transporter (DMT)-like permease
LWNFSLRRLSAIESAAINNTMLVQIAVLAWIFLDERPGALGIIGIALVSMDVFLAQALGRPISQRIRVNEQAE